MMAGKWQKYADSQGLWLGQLLNRNMREVLKIGVNTLVANTQMDSGRAAAHWVVIPNRGKVRPGAWKQMKFDPVYGRPPVGKPGDKKTESGAEGEVIKAVVSREWNRAISKAISGRNPATGFAFHSSIPPFFDDSQGVETGPSETPGIDSYWENAHLEEAKEAALSKMTQKFNALMAAARSRKNPLR